MFFCNVQFHWQNPIGKLTRNRQTHLIHCYCFYLARTQSNPPFLSHPPTARHLLFRHGRTLSCARPVHCSLFPPFTHSTHSISSFPVASVFSFLLFLFHSPSLALQPSPYLQLPIRPPNFSHVRASDSQLLKQINIQFPVPLLSPCQLVCAATAARGVVGGRAVGCIL